MDADTIATVAQLIEKAVDALRIDNTSSLKPEDLKKYEEIQSEFSRCLKITNEYCISYQPFYTFLCDAVDNYSMESLRAHLVKCDFDKIVDKAHEIASSTYNLGLSITEFQETLARKYVSKSPFWRYFGDAVMCLGGISLIVIGCTIPGFQPLIVSGALMTAGSVVRFVVDFQDARTNADIMKKIAILRGKLDTAVHHMSALSKAARTHSEKVKLVQIAFGMEGEATERSTEAFKKYVHEMCSSFQVLADALNKAIDRKPAKRSMLNTVGTVAQGSGAIAAVATAVVMANDSTGGAVEHAAHVVSWCSIM